MKLNVDMPDSIKNYKATSKYLSEAYSTKVVEDAAQAVANAGGKVNRVTSKRMEATIKTMTNRGLIDLKPFFKQSSHVKYTKDGNWYMVVPIALKRRTLRRQYGNDNTYNRIKDAFSSLSPSTSATLNIQDVFSGNTPNTLPSLVPPQRSNNVTAFKSQTGKRTSYFAFRTVSSKSAPQSWVLNRENLNEDNTSESLQNGIRVLIEKRIKQIEELL